MGDAKSLRPPDSHHLQAAEGWIGLGNYADAGKWDACLDIVTALTTMTPERRFGWIHRAHTLDKLGRTMEAKDLLLSVVNDFDANSTMPYHLAQYCARLGQIDQAKQWLGKALLAADGLEAADRLRNLALEDPNLEPLRRMP